MLKEFQNCNAHLKRKKSFIMYVLKQNIKLKILFNNDQMLSFYLDWLLRKLTIKRDDISNKQYNTFIQNNNNSCIINKYLYIAM